MLALLLVLTIGSMNEFYRIARMKQVTPLRIYPIAIGAGIVITSFFVATGAASARALTWVLPAVFILFIAGLYDGLKSLNKESRLFGFKGGPGGLVDNKYVEITDEFIKDAAGAESVDAYKKETRERLEKQAKEKGDAETENNIVKAITETSEVEIPDAMIESQMDMMMRNMEYRLGMQYGGMKLADYLRYMGTDLATFREGYRAQATETVKSQLVVDKIIREEGIKAEEAEIDAKLEEFAKAADKTLEEYKKDVDASQREYVANDIVINKLFDMLRASNNMVSEPVKAEEKKPAAKKTAKKAEGEEKPAAKKTAKKAEGEEKPAAKKTAKKAEGEEKPAKKAPAKKTAKKAEDKAE